MRPDLVKKAAEVMKQLSDYLGEKKWFAGEAVLVLSVCLNSYPSVFISLLHSS